MNINRTMLDSFMLQGFWTVDGEHEVQGLLECTQGKARLTLLESLLVDIDDIFSQSSDIIPRVWGFAQTGEQILLINCVYTVKSTYMPGCSEYICRAESMLISDGYFKAGKSHCDLRTVLQKIEIRKIEFQLAWLHVWIGRTAILDSSYPNGTESISYNLDEYNTETYSFGESFFITARKRIHQHHGSDLFARNTNVNESDVIHIEKREGSLALTEALIIIRRISTLIELLVDESMPFVLISFALPIGQYEGSEEGLIAARYFMSQINTNSAEPHVSCIKLNKLSGNFQSVLNSWNKYYDMLLLVVNDYLGAKRMERYLETSLLLSIRSLEILGRDFDLTNTKTAPDSIDVKMTNGQLKLRPNLTALLKLLPPVYIKRYLQPLVLSDLGSDYIIDEFVNKLVETRNYYTHNDKNKPYAKRYKTVRELHEVTISLRCLIKFFLFRILTIPEELTDENLLSVFRVSNIGKVSNG